VLEWEMLRAETVIPDLAFAIALAAGWMALLVALAGPTPRCRCCERVSEAESRDRGRRVGRPR
jgi:hypothetical protein